MVGHDLRTTTTVLIDTHCHLDDAAFADDYDDVIAESTGANVRGWINVGFEPGRWTSSIALKDRTPGMSVMLGVHPSSAEQWSISTRDGLERLLRESGAVAIGEIGLDFLRSLPAKDLQARVFIDQLALALEIGLPVAIHMRESEETMIEILRQRQPLPRLLFHSYDGGPAMTDFVLSTGAFVGVGGLATRKSSERLRHELQRIPLSQMVLESDSPYLVPARIKSRRNTPAQVHTIMSFLAKLKSEQPSQVALVTTLNAFDLFGRLITA